MAAGRVINIAVVEFILLRERRRSGAVD